MKIAVLTIAFNEEEWIKGCIDQFGGRFKHLVLVSERPWHGNWKPDHTAVVAVQHGVDVIVGQWTSEAEQRNDGLSMLRDFDWVIICDADERYTFESIDFGAEILNSLKREKRIDGVRASDMEVYWKTPDFKIIPKQQDGPLIAVRPSAIFTNKRAIIGETNWMEMRLHHFSYVRSNQEMLKKIQSFDHADEFDTRKWYDDIWMNWSPDMRYLHPVVPPQFDKAVWDPCPEEIRRLVP